jgi:hypothetical protein
MKVVMKKLYLPLLMMVPIVAMQEQDEDQYDYSFTDKLLKLHSGFVKNFDDESYDSSDDENENTAKNYKDNGIITFHNLIMHKPFTEFNGALGKKVSCIQSMLTFDGAVNGCACLTPAGMLSADLAKRLAGDDLLPDYAIDYGTTIKKIDENKVLTLRTVFETSYYEQLAKTTENKVNDDDTFSVDSADYAYSTKIACLYFHYKYKNKEEFRNRQRMWEEKKVTDVALPAHLTSLVVMKCAAYNNLFNIFKVSDSSESKSVIMLKTMLSVNKTDLSETELQTPTGKFCQQLLLHKEKKKPLDTFTVRVFADDGSVGYLTVLNIKEWKIIKDKVRSELIAEFFGKK